MSDWTKEDFNSVKLIGRAGRDFETRFTAGGVAISSGSIATGGGEKKDGSKWPTEWFDLKAFRKDDGTGDDLADVKAGDTVVVKSGKLTQERWNDKETSKPRSKVVVIVNELEIVKKKGDGVKKAEPDYHIPEGDTDSIPF